MTTILGDDSPSQGRLLFWLFALKQSDLRGRGSVGQQTDIEFVTFGEETDIFAGERLEEGFDCLFVSGVWEWHRNAVRKFGRWRNHFHRWSGDAGIALFIDEDNKVMAVLSKQN